MKTNGIDGPVMAMIDGRFARLDISVTDLGPQDEILKRISQSLPTSMLNAFVLPGGKMAHVQVKGDLIICWTEITSLRIATVWSIGSDGTRYPVFKHRVETSPPEHEAAYDWAPLTAGMRMFFASVFKFQEGRYVWNMSYLVCKAPKRKEIFRPPLPNIFSDARMCMGNDYSHSSPCLADAFAHSLAHLDASKWNADAMEGLTLDNMKALFSFKDNKQVPPPKDYKWFELRACAAVNNINYGELPIV